jgi:hypothetical protein
MKNATQNVSFAGPDIRDRTFERPAGYGISVLLHDAISDLADVGAIENWRDVGWSFCIGDAENRQLEFALTGAFGDDVWMARICPRIRLNWFGRLIGKKTPDLTNEIYDISIEIDRVLRSNGFTGFCWRLNGEPIARHDPPRPVDNTGRAG